LPINSGLALSERQVEEALVRMNATGAASKESYEKDYNFKRNLNTIRRFINNDIQLDEDDSNGLNGINNKLKIRKFNNNKKIESLDKNIKILAENKEIEIDGKWGDILNYHGRKS
jgi:predicted RNase H-like nuclease (RuvC/YqgF family)